MSQQSFGLLWLQRSEKDSCIKTFLKKPLEDIEEVEAQAWHRKQKPSGNDTPPQLCIDNFSFEELHNVMKRNGSQILGLFNEMSTMYSQLDLYSLDL